MASLTTFILKPNRQQLWATLRAASTTPSSVVFSNLLAALQTSHYQHRTLPTFAVLQVINVRERPAKPTMLDSAQRNPQPLSLALHNASQDKLCFEDRHIRFCFRRYPLTSNVRVILALVNRLSRCTGCGRRLWNRYVHDALSIHGAGGALTVLHTEQKKQETQCPHSYEMHTRTNTKAQKQHGNTRRSILATASAQTDLLEKERPTSDRAYLAYETATGAMQSRQGRNYVRWCC